LPVALRRKTTKDAVGRWTAITLAGRLGDVVKMTSASLSAFALLGVLSTVDDCYHGLASPGMQPVRESVEASNLASDGENTFLIFPEDFVPLHVGQGTIFAEIGQEVRDWTNFQRCWRKIDRYDDLAESVARLCTAIAGPF
jgi:hypothetical protein